MVTSKLLLCYYADDFTGATDSLEVLASKGLKTVLFLAPPSQKLLAERFSDIQCLGIAGVSRSMTPSEMDCDLRSILEALAQTEAPVIHYKICSTADSSPEIGSVGKVLDIAGDIFKGQTSIPMLVASPPLKRFTIFGHHFAHYDGDIYRLDRHPVMSKHPITPMSESDLTIHLGKQTNKSIGLMNVLELDGDREEVLRRYERLAEAYDVVLFDALQQRHVREIGHLIWKSAEQRQIFVMGSSGVQSSLTEYWTQSKWISPHSVSNSIQRTKGLQDSRLLVLSGSCSPMTSKQIEHALDHGFKGYKIPVSLFQETSDSMPLLEKVIEEVSSMLRQGDSVILYSALGPDDPDIALFTALLQGEKTNSGSIIGQKLGQMAKAMIEREGLKRILIAGGDTSGFATRQLGIYCLDMIESIAPGAPLCRGYSFDPRMDGVELALKGGQLGQIDYFTRVRLA